MGRGGARKGAGRKKKGNVPVTIRVPETAITKLGKEALRTKLLEHTLKLMQDD